MGKKITDLPVASTLVGTELLEIVQSLANKKVTVADLLGLVPNLYKGLYTTLAALNSAHPTSVAGAFADVDAGVGSAVQRYIWDSNDSEWTPQTGGGGGMTNPMTTAGDIVIGSTGGTPARLGIGSALQVLRVNPAGTALEYATPAGAGNQCLAIACSDEATSLTAGAAKVTFRMPYAFILSGVRASLTTPQTSGSILTVDINEGGTSILSTKLTIDNTEKTSATAAASAVISDTALADDSEITIDLDQIGDGTAKGLKVYLIGVPA